MKRVHRTTSRTLAVLALTATMAFGIAAATTAHAQATIDDCEKIQAADAYNQCLAKFGPTSKVKSVEPEKPTDFKANGAEAAATAGPSKGHGGGRHAGRRRGSRVSHGGSGRRRIAISVHRRHK